MQILEKTLFSLKKIFTAKKANRELDDEIQFHIEMSVEQKVSNGMPRKQAEKEAQREFGNGLSIREACRMSWGARFADELQQDFAYGIRRLYGNKLFSFSIILILASCIAVSIFNYNNLDKNILNPTSIPDSERLVVLQRTWESANGIRHGFSHFLYEELRKLKTEAFDDIALLGNERLFASHKNKTERITAGSFTPAAWQIFKTPPFVGRYFTEEDLNSNNDKVVVLRYSQSIKWFGSAQNALNQTVRLNGESYEVIAVLPKSFRLMNNRFDLVIPKILGENDYSANPSMILSNSSDCILRLNDGATLDQIRSIVNTLNRRICESNKGYAQIDKYLKIRQLASKYTDIYSFRKLDTKTLQYTFTFLSVLLFVIGVLNSNALLSVNLGNRSKELVTRFSLGAKRLRMLRQLGFEISLLYIVSLLFGSLAICAYVLLTKSDFPSIYSLVFPATIVLCGLSTSMFVILRKIRKRKLEQNFKDAQTTTSRRSKGIASLLGIQVSLTVFILLIASFLTINVNRIINEDYGFSHENKLITKIRCPEWKYHSNAASTRKTIEEIKSIFMSNPWSQTFSISEDLPQTWGVGHSRGYGTDSASTIISPEIAEKYPNISLQIYRADENFLSQIGMRLLKGRWLNEFDATTPEREIVVEKKLIETLFPEKDPIGAIFQEGNQGAFKIVGVVDEIEYGSRQFKTQQNDASFITYEHIFEDHSHTEWVNHVTGFGFLTTTPSDLEAAKNLQKQLQAVDPDLHVEMVTYREEIMSKNTRLISARNTSLILACFTFVLASYGLFSYLVYRFHLLKKELAIRIALGAKLKEILLRFISLQSIPVLVGTTFGAIVAYITVSNYSDRFTEVTPSDPLPYLCITVLVFCLLALATILPSYQLKKLPLRDTLTIE